MTTPHYYYEEPSFAIGHLGPYPTQVFIALRLEAETITEASRTLATLMTLAVPNAR